MSTTPREQSPRPSLEELLRLKRAERPDADFWQEFERGLRDKQLAAIVEPKPWWLGLSLFARRVPVAAWSIPTGAAAALIAMMSLATVPGVRTAEVAASEPHAPQVAAESTAPAQQAPALEIAAATLALEVQESVSEDTAEPAPLQTESSLVPAIASVAPAEVEDTAPRATPVLMALADKRPAKADNLLVAAAIPTAPDNSAGLPALSLIDWAGEQMEQLPQLIDLSVASLREALESASVSGVSVSSVSPRVIEDNPVLVEHRFEDPRHARLLSSPIVSSEADKSLSHARERVVRRLADGEELYASVTRWGASGDRLSVRF